MSSLAVRYRMKGVEVDLNKSEITVKMQRFHYIRYCMVERGYITLEQYMTELLDYQRDLGIINPATEEKIIEPSSEQK